MKEKAPKKVVEGGNVAPVGRWIWTLILSLLVGSIFSGLVVKIIRALPIFAEGSYLFAEEGLIEGIAGFLGLYLAFWLFLKALCKTRLRDFFFGKDRKIDVKKTLIIGGIYAIGFVLSALINVKYITFECDDILLWLINVVFCLLFLWIQTTTEEIYFRGLFLRVPFGNDMPVLKKGIICAVVSSLLFMSLHLFNPEFTTRGGFDAACMACAYFISGFGMFFANLYSGGLEAGILIHLVNNFLCFTLIRDKVTVMPTPTLFVNNYSGNNVGLIALLVEIITNGLVIAYCIYMMKKKETTVESN